MAFTTINYDDGNKENLGYKSVEIHYGKKEQKKFFKSGNFVKDWWDLRKFQIQKLSGKEAFFTHSSTVDNFIMDGAPYDSAYMHMVEDKAVLKYIDRKDKNFLFNQRDVYEGIEFFVPEDTQPTWEELKEMCK